MASWVAGDANARAEASRLRSEGFRAALTEQTATAPADGYTLMFAPDATVFLTPLVQKISVDPMTALIPITNVGTGAQVVAIKRSLPVTTLQEFLDYARANPGKLNYASVGPGSVPHIGGVMLNKEAGIDLSSSPLG